MLGKNKIERARCGQDIEFMSRCRICKKETELLANVEKICTECWVKKYAWKWSDKDIKTELKKQEV